MRDLEVLLSRVRDPDIREHFQEAIRTYQVGAFRSAIINTWICVALDLIRKIRFLALQGEKAAEKHVEKLDCAIHSSDIPQLQEIERNLLETAKEFELISGREYIELNHLYKDRHACAHPAFLSSEEVFSPRPELARAHLAAAVDNALSLPPISGRKRIQELQAELNSDAWPIYSDKWSYLETRFLSNVRESVQRQILEFLLKIAIDPPDESEIKITRREMSKRAREAIHAISNKQPILIEVPLQSVLHKKVIDKGCNDEVLLRVVAAVGHLPSTWQVLGTPLIDRLITLIRELSFDELLDKDTFAGQSVFSDEIRDSLISRLLGDLLSEGDKSDNFEILLTSLSWNRNKLITPAIKYLSESPSFRSAEHRLQLIITLATEFCAEDICEIGEVIRKSRQILFATKTESILIELFELVKNSSPMVQAMATLRDVIWKAAADEPDPPAGFRPSFDSLKDRINQEKI